MSRTGDRIGGSTPESSVREAAASIDDDATLAVSGFGSVGYPKAVPRELARSDRDLALTVLSGGSVGDEIDTALVEADAVARRFPYQATTAAREAVNAGEIAFHDRHISRLGDEVAYGGLVDVDVAVIEAVAVGEDWLIPSTSIGHTPAYVEAADELIVEVNDAQPLALRALHDVYRPTPPPRREPIPLLGPGDRIGGEAVRFDPGKLTAVVRSSRPDSPYTFRDPTPTDEAVAANLADFLTAEIDRNPVLAETVNVQFGVGSLGNALASALSSVDFGDRTVSYFGEVIQDGLLDLLDAGLLDAASATSLALSEDGQRRLFDDLERYAEDVILRPADLSNAPALISRFGVVGVNAALEVDLSGHANSTHLRGSHLLNGVGGSGDFNRNALVSIVALGSTAADGEISRIVPGVAHVDHTEHDIGVVVTEQGVADLRGLSPRERADALIEECAHPDFRPALRDYLASAGGGHIPHDLSRAADWYARDRDHRDGDRQDKH